MRYDLVCRDVSAPVLNQSRMSSEYDVVDVLTIISVHCKRNELTPIIVTLRGKGIDVLGVDERHCARSTRIVMGEEMG